MLLESVAVAAAALNQIGSMIETAGQVQGGAQRVMGAILDFGQGLDELENNKKDTFFEQSHSDLLRIQMMRRQQQRYEQDLENLLSIADPILLDQYRQSKREQVEKRKAHQKALADAARKRKELIQQIITISAIVITGLVAAAIVTALIIMVLK